MDSIQEVDCRSFHKSKVAPIGSFEHPNMNLLWYGDVYTASWHVKWFGKVCSIDFARPILVCPR